MKNIKHIERLQRLHNLIKMECTGSPSEVAFRLGISERTVYYLIEQLKDYEAKIGYDRSRKTYFYKDDFVLEVNFSICIGAHDHVMEILEGSYLKPKKFHPQD
ncbi:MULTISPECIES: DNA-binding protein [Robiginitalea]|uniref:Putative DNA-binding protein n=1 Tax=Robiginitalea biformata (strain ATCC BAA-864 / DSM 15991 / KCTC 12146 / HTCC2501) TaxID=313596 RepID=A4CLE1_ROBBH|nr:MULTISPECIES: DNA-binding protein [Robiginitalea]EAR15690.1 putative DNA-binding protein [Robiginitalea biformata HTCC2501]MDC6354119.1 DNA-binding protein [Robiginitalea sp. PM2]MDC6374386.1 DNA-binding protein [Robiginitalea sp. SP8]